MAGNEKKQIGFQVEIIVEPDGDEAILFLTTKKPLSRLFVWRLPGDCNTYNLCN
jgi:hypothetical protein